MSEMSKGTEKGLSHLLEAAGDSLALEELDLSGVKIGNAHVKLFFRAMERGALQTLTQLTLGFDKKVTKLPALIQAIEAGHLKELSCLSLGLSGISVQGAEALAGAILVGCPKLRRWALGYIEEEAVSVMQRVLAGRQGIKVFVDEFWRYR